MKNKRFFLHPTKTGLALALGIVFAAQAQSEKATAGSKLERVELSGQRANLISALEKQREAQGVLSVVHADDIGQLPDNNAAEALARLPGVSVERDQGEGRFVRVRGLGSDYNNVTINGATVPASEAGRRAPGLDVVPAGLIRSLEVDKTLTPEQDANSIGGHVSVNTLSAFDLKGPLFTLEGGTNYDANAGKTRPRGALTYADRFAGGRLGVALALSMDQRRFASDNVETGGAWDGDKLEGLELRRYAIERERIGGAFSIDYKPGAEQHLYLRGFASKFTDEEVRQSQAIDFATALAAGAQGKATAARGLKQRQEIAKTSSLALGGSQSLAAWRLAAEAGLGRASEDTPDALASSAFTASFDGVGFSDGRRPLLQGPAVMTTAAPYALDKMKIESSLARDHVRHLKLDLRRAFELGGETELEFKTGLKATRRHKDSEQETYAVKGKSIGKPTLVSLSGQPMVDYPWGGSFGPAIDAGLMRQLIGTLDLSKFRDPADSATNDFDLHEDVDAGYAQLKYERGGMELLGGLRMERIGFRADGYGLRDGKLAPVEVRTRDTHWLPALLLKQDLGGATLLRAALTHSLVRPSFEQLAPGLLIDGDEAELGNPKLRPLRSRNLDLGIEQGLGRDGREGTLSAYAFSKRIKEFVFQTDLAGSPGWEDYSSVNTFANGQRASVRGLELAYAQALRALPAPWNGLVVGANATFTHSRARIGGYEDGQWKGRDISLPSQSDRSFNVSLGWEGQGFSTRLALNQQSSYLLEVGDLFSPSKDLRVDGQKQVDFALKYSPSKQLTVSFEALNLANTAYYVYQQTAAHNAQYERYGRAYKLGLKWSLF